MARFNRRQVFFPLEKHLTELERVLGELDDKVHLRMLREYAMSDRKIQYEMIARFLPLSMQQLVELLTGLIIEEKVDGIIHEETEVTVEKLADRIMERSTHHLKESAHGASLDGVLAILVAVETEMSYVYDEGNTFQCVIEDGFSFLQKIAQQSMTKRDAEILCQRIEAALALVPQQDRFYEDQWREVIALFKNKINE